jgi:dTDP-4-dehydrorhamnose 3,5-epimerase
MSFGFKVLDSEKVNGVKIVIPSVAKDTRGTVWTSFLKEELNDLLPDNLSFIHDKFSESQNNVLRGIHGDEKTWKLVTSVYGEIYQVVVDCRKESDTYGNWQDFTISKDQQCSVLIPPGVGNAFYVLSQTAVYHYKLAYRDGYNDIENQFTVSWDDKNYNIKWPTDKPILSERDSIEGISIK